MYHTLAKTRLTIDGLSTAWFIPGVQGDARCRSRTYKWFSKQTFTYLHSSLFSSLKRWENPSPFAFPAWRAWNHMKSSTEKSCAFRALLPVQALGPGSAVGSARSSRSNLSGRPCGTEEYFSNRFQTDFCPLHLRSILPYCFVCHQEFGWFRSIEFTEKKFAQFVNKTTRIYASSISFPHFLQE